MVIPAPSKPQRVVFLGTPEVACEPLRALYEAGFEIPLVITRPDKRRGRGKSLSPSPVKALAIELGLPVSSQVDDVLNVGAELGVVVAYGRIIKPHILDQLAMINLHFSLLPRWRGAAPVERAILAGDHETGVCVMEVAEGLDTGGIYRQETVVIDANETVDELRGRLSNIGAALMVQALRDGLGAPKAQVGEVTYAEKLKPEELQIDWSKSALEIHRLVRLGGAWTTHRGKRFKLHTTQLISPEDHQELAPGEVHHDQVGTGEGELRMLVVQPEGKARQDATSWRNGARLSPGELLGT